MNTVFITCCNTPKPNLLFLQAVIGILQVTLLPLKSIHHQELKMRQRHSGRPGVYHRWLRQHGMWQCFCHRLRWCIGLPGSFDASRKVEDRFLDEFVRVKGYFSVFCGRVVESGQSSNKEETEKQ